MQDVFDNPINHSFCEGVQRLISRRPFLLVHLPFEVPRILKDGGSRRVEE
jgi:hypothetical protein